MGSRAPLGPWNLPSSCPVTLSDLAQVSHVRGTHWEPGMGWGGSTQLLWSTILVTLGCDSPQFPCH